MLSAAALGAAASPKPRRKRGASSGTGRGDLSPGALTNGLTKAAVARFWSKVERGADCWLWTAAHAKFGHGLFWLDGKLVQAHRVSWLIHFGQIPKGLSVLHKCDQPSCVRPSHLFLGTQRANVHDMWWKGRQRGGRRSNQAGTRLRAA